MNVYAQQPEVAAELQKETERIRAEFGEVRIIGSDQRPHHLKDPNLKN